MIKTIKIITLTLLLGAASAWAGEQTVKLSVPGMNCVSCPYMVKKVISRVDGVLSVSATMKDRSATVSFDDAKTTIEQVRAATASIGYPSTVVPSKGT
jgi:mercuric ion binding protein